MRLFVGRGGRWFHGIFHAVSIIVPTYDYFTLTIGNVLVVMVGYSLWVFVCDST